MKKLINAITAPFRFFAALLAESREINEDGSWDTYWAKKHCRAELRELKTQYKANKIKIKAKWGTNK